MDLFITSRKVEESLSAKNTTLCVAWCQDNKSKLKRMKVIFVLINMYQ